MPRNTGLAFCFESVLCFFLVLEARAPARVKRVKPFSRRHSSLLSSLSPLSQPLNARILSSLRQRFRERKFPDLSICIHRILNLHTTVYLLYVYICYVYIYTLYCICYTVLYSLHSGKQRTVCIAPFSPLDSLCLVFLFSSSATFCSSDALLASCLSPPLWLVAVASEKQRSRLMSPVVKSARLPCHLPRLSKTCFRRKTPT